MAIPTVLFLSSFATALPAQTVRVDLVNGRNGRPIVNACVGLWIGDKSQPRSRPWLTTQTDDHGFIIVRLTNTTEATGSTQSQKLACGLWGVIHPTVKYGDTINVSSDYALCQARLPDGSWKALEGFSTKEALQSGIATANTCGKATASPKPGQIVFFVRPLTLWEKLKTY